MLADSIIRNGNADSALVWLTTTQTNLEIQGKSQSNDYEALLFAIGNHYSRTRQYRFSAEIFQKTLTLHEAIAPKDLENQIAIIDKLADSYDYLDLSKSIPLYKKALALRISVSGADSHSAAIGHHNLAVAYCMVGDFENATETALKALRTLKNAGLTLHADYAGYHQMMGWIYHEEGNLPEALKYYQSALPLLQARLGKHIETAKILSVIGEVYAKMGNTEQALAYQIPAVAMFEQTDTASGIYLANGYSFLGITYNYANQPIKALEYFQRALNVGAKPGTKPAPDPFLDLFKSRSYRLMGNYDLALALIDASISGLKSQPSVENYYWYALLNKADILAQQFRLSQNTAKLIEATAILDESQAIMSNLIAGFDNERNKLAVYRNAVDVLDLSISIYTQLYEATRDLKWLKTAFEFSEMSKGLLLYQQVLENKSRRREACIPAELADAEKATHTQLIDAEKRLHESEDNVPAAEKDQLRESIFQLKKQQETLRKSIEDVCHESFMETASFPQIKFDALQNDLSSTEGLLEYFVGDSTITAFLLRRDTLVFRRISHKIALEKGVGQLRESVCRYFNSPQKNSDIFLQSAKDYTESAFYLYQMLMAPFGKLLPEQLTIVPDGLLAYLPFEALLQEKAERPDRFHLHHYVAKDFTVRYACSATLLREMENLPILPASSDRLLAMAPFFDRSTNWNDSLLAFNADRSRFDFSALPFSGEEVYKVAKTTGGIALSGAQASESTFLQEAPKYHALHLATHAQANDMAGDFSFLAFAPIAGRPNANRLYVSEIYGLQLNAELVTLSACETGLGQMYRGEGIVSIARAFASAGAHSIVQSQWVVSDAQTRSLMEFFYKNLKKGQPKDTALQEARLEYLRTFRGEEAHPYFWASFILIGDRKPLSFFRK